MTSVLPQAGFEDQPRGGKRPDTTLLPAVNADGLRAQPSAASVTDEQDFPLGIGPPLAVT